MHRETSQVLPEELAADPWALDGATRRRLAHELAEAQAHWLARLTDLVEPPAPDASFPAFLIEAPQFASLRQAVGDARTARELDTATADQLQRFVDLYRDYLTDHSAL